MRSRVSSSCWWFCSLSGSKNALWWSVKSTSNTLACLHSFIPFSKPSFFPPFPLFFTFYFSFVLRCSLFVVSVFFLLVDGKRRKSSNSKKISLDQEMAGKPFDCRVLFSLFARATMNGSRDRPVLVLAGCSVLCHFKLSLAAPHLVHWSGGGGIVFSLDEVKGRARRTAGWE